MHSSGSPRPTIATGPSRFDAASSAPDPARSSRPLFGAAWVHRLVGNNRLVRSVLMGLHARLELAILAGHKEAGPLARIRRIRRDRESLLSGNEAYMLASLAQSQAALAPDAAMAEVGVYQGCSAKIISESSGGAALHLFDTFAGLPAPASQERARLCEGQYAATLASVQAFLSDRPDVHFHAGVFPHSASALADLRFSFVHLDVDLKASTLACLKFFYPRMVSGGVILSHDYSYLDGVKEAFGEFMATRREKLIELATSQAMIVKL